MGSALQSWRSKKWRKKSNSDNLFAALHIPMGSTRRSNYTNCSSAVLGTAKISVFRSSVLWIFLDPRWNYSLIFTIVVHIPLCQRASKLGSGEVTAGKEQCSTFSLQSATQVQPRSSPGHTCLAQPKQTWDSVGRNTNSPACQCSLLAALCLLTHTDTDEPGGSRQEAKLNSCVCRAQDSIRALPMLWEHFFRAGKAAPSGVGQAHFSWQPPVGTKENRNCWRISISWQALPKSACTSLQTLMEGETLPEWLCPGSAEVPAHSCSHLVLPMQRHW